MEIKVLPLVLIVNFVHVLCDCEQNKIIYNMVVKKQIQSLDALLKMYNKTYINMSKSKFDISEDIQADGVKLYDITTITSGDTYLWTAPGDTEYAEAKLGLDTMTLVIKSLQYNGETYSDANVTVNNVFMKFLQTIKFNRTNCDESYSDFEFFPVNKAVINDDKDVTNDFNKIVVPWVNKQINSNAFIDLVEEYFTSACNEEAALRLLKLIESPYSE